MQTPKNKNRFLTWAVVVVSLAGFFYFGYQAVLENSRRNGENPFAYDVEEFKQSGRDRIDYQEVDTIKIALNPLSGLAFGPDDMLYVSGGSTILVYDSAHSLVSRFAAAGPPGKRTGSWNGGCVIAR